MVKGVKGNYWPEQTWGKFRNQDRNFSGRLRLWKEGWWKEWTPQLVLGANDPGSFDNNGGGNINLIKKLVLIIISIVFSGCNETFVFSECGGIRASYGLYL